MDGETALVLTDDLETLLRSSGNRTVRLLPGYDQWVLGPGTADPHVVPPARRSPVTRGANLVTVGGVVNGTWAVSDEQLTVSWFAEVGPAPEEAVVEQAGLVADLLGRSLRFSLSEG